MGNIHVPVNRKHTAGMVKYIEAKIMMFENIHAVERVVEHHAE